MNSSENSVPQSIWTYGSGEYRPSPRRSCTNIAADQGTSIAAPNMVSSSPIRIRLRSRANIWATASAEDRGDNGIRKPEITQNPR